MAVLTSEQQLFLVDELAMHSTPTEAADAFREQFGITIDRAQVAKYDPHGVAGRQMSAKLKARHAETRAKFDEEVQGSRIASRAWRIRRLEEVERLAFKRKNLTEVRACLEQAAKECGDSYTNVHKIKHSGSVKSTSTVHLGEETRAALANKLLDAVERLKPEGGK